jgi:hypothetical protein
MAAGDLTTLAKVKSFLKLSVSTDDVLLASLITGLSEWAQDQMNRSIAVAVYTDRFSGNGQRKHFFSRGPVTAVYSVSINGVGLTVERDYWFNANVIELMGGTFPPGGGNCLIQFQAGYAVTPPGLEQAITELVAMVYRARDQINVSSKTVGQETVSFITTSGNSRVLDAIAAWRWQPPT